MGPFVFLYIYLAAIYAPAHQTSYHFQSHLYNHQASSYSTQRATATRKILQMRPSWVFSLLVLSLLLAKVKGIRLDRESLAVHQQQTQKHDEESTLMEKSNNGEEAEEFILCKDEQCTGTLKRRLSRVSSRKSSHKWLPRIHEDYYGPRHHRSRHH